MQRLQTIRLAMIGWVALMAVTFGVGAEDQVYSAAPAGAPSTTDNAGIPTAAGDPSGFLAERAGVRSRNFSIGATGTLTLTDNVSLARPGQEEEDLVLGLSVPLGLRREGSRVKLTVDYAPTVYLYTRSTEANDVWHNLRSFVSVETVDDFLFVEASANSYPTYISALFPRPVSGGSITENRTQQTTMGVSPYIRREAGGGWAYLVRNDNFWTTYSAGPLADSFSSRITAEIESPPARLRYGFDYTYLYSRDDSQPTAYYQQVARVRPILTVTRKLSVSGRLGYEANDYVTEDSGPVYGAGVEWTPTARTRLDGFLEDRFFGASYGLNFNHRTRRTGWKLSATRNTYTSAEQPLTLRPGTTAEVVDEAFRSRIADPVQREQEVKRFLERSGLPPSLTQPYTFYTNQIYLAEQVTGSVALLGRRNTAELTLFWQENEPITTSGDVLPGVLVTFDRLRQRGARLTFSHRLSGFSSVALTANRLYSLTDSGVTSVDEIDSIEDTVRLSLTHQLSPRSDGSIAVQWVNFNSDVSPYRELAVTAALAHSF